MPSIEVHSAAGAENDSAGLVGRIYAANTFGAILGSLVFTLILIPWIGTDGAEKTLIVLAAVGGLVVLGPLVWRGRAESRPISRATSAARNAPAHKDRRRRPRTGSR